MYIIIKLSSYYYYLVIIFFPHERMGLHDHILVLNKPNTIININYRYTLLIIRLYIVRIYIYIYSLLINTY